MAKKALAYILIILGLIGMAYYAVPQINTALKSYVPSGVTDIYIIVGGVVLFIIGILILKKKKHGLQKGYEFPIYHGGNVVGYRRN